MKYTETNFSIRSSTILIFVSMVIPLWLGYLAVHNGVNQQIACPLSGLAGLVAGSFAHKRAFRDYFERKSRIAMIQYELDSRRNHNDENPSVIDSLPEVESKAIGGQTFDRMQRAIAAFPERYPGYQSKPPKLNDDVRAWLKVNYGASEREAHVFGAIISEHFKLSPDTLETP